MGFEVHVPTSGQFARYKQRIAAVWTDDQMENYPDIATSKSVNILSPSVLWASDIPNIMTQRYIMSSEKSPFHFQTKQMGSSLPVNKTPFPEEVSSRVLHAWLVGEGASSQKCLLAYVRPNGVWLPLLLGESTEVNWVETLANWGLASSVSSQGMDEVSFDVQANGTNQHSYSLRTLADWVCGTLPVALKYIRLNLVC